MTLKRHFCLLIICLCTIRVNSDIADNEIIQTGEFSQMQALDRPILHTFLVEMEGILVNRIRIYYIHFSVTLLQMESLHLIYTVFNNSEIAYILNQSPQE